jgi:hypothetical protein
LLPEALEVAEGACTSAVALEVAAQGGIRRFLELPVLVQRIQLRWVPEGPLVQTDQPRRLTQIHQLEEAGVLRLMRTLPLLAALAVALRLITPRALQEPPGKAPRAVMAAVILPAAF